MSTPTKQAPAKTTQSAATGTPTPAKAEKPKIDFSTLQVVEGGTIRHSTSNPLEGTPIPAQLAASWAAQKDGKGSTFTVGPVSADAEETLKSMYRRGAADAGHGVAFTYNKSNGALTVRAQAKKAFDMSPDAVARRKAARAAKKAAKG